MFRKTEAEMLKMLFPNFTPPFDIGKFGRRSRSYSCSGSERSRDGTPTRSDSGEGEEDFVEESKERIYVKIFIGT